MGLHIDAAELNRLIGVLVDQLASHLPSEGPINIVGIRTGGETLAARIEKSLRDKGFSQIGRGVLDITLYRDDLSEVGPRPLVRPTSITVPLDGLPLILIDDVLFTGRSVRAALDLLADYGRPSAIRLAVLVDRGGRELPIQPDFAALTLRDIPRSHRVNVRFTETDGRDEILVEPKPEAKA
jgi:pyrimidine operon attenuation protein/uracil phosphoribosyltransferase